MRIAGIAAVAALIAFVLYFGGVTGVGENAGESKSATCVRDDAAGAAHAQAGAAARGFFEALLAGKTPDEALAPAAKEKLAKQLSAEAKRLAAAGPYGEIRLQHTFHPSAEGENARITCGEIADLKQVTVSALRGVVQAHALLAVRARNEEVALTAWLLADNDVWRIHAFNAAPASVAGQGPAALLRKADEQTKKGHDFNARMLYRAARSAVERGDDLSLGVAADIDAALARTKAPPDLDADPGPLTWRFAGTDFALDAVSFIGVDGRLGLVFLHRDPTWDGEDTGKAERRNKRLIDGFVKAHPEYKETFAFLVARILAPGKDTGWGTVFDADRGYDTGEPGTAKMPKRRNS